MISNVEQTVYRTGSRICNKNKNGVENVRYSTGLFKGTLRFLLILSEKSFGLSMAETLEILTCNCMIQVTVYILKQ